MTTLPSPTTHTRTTKTSTTTQARSSTTKSIATITPTTIVTNTQTTAKKPCHKATRPPSTTTIKATVTTTTTKASSTRSKSSTALPTKKSLAAAATTTTTKPPPSKQPMNSLLSKTVCFLEALNTSLPTKPPPTTASASSNNGKVHTSNARKAHISDTGAPKDKCRSFDKVAKSISMSFGEGINNYDVVYRNNHKGSGHLGFKSASHKKHLPLSLKHHNNDNEGVVDTTDPNHKKHAHPSGRQADKGVGGVYNKIIINYNTSDHCEAKNMANNKNKNNDLKRISNHKNNDKVRKVEATRRDGKDGSMERSGVAEEVERVDAVVEKTAEVDKGLDGVVEGLDGVVEGGPSEVGRGASGGFEERGGLARGTVVPKNVINKCTINVHVTRPTAHLHASTNSSSHHNNTAKKSLPGNYSSKIHRSKSLHGSSSGVNDTNDPATATITKCSQSQSKTSDRHWWEGGVMEADDVSLDLRSVSRKRRRCINNESTFVLHINNCKPPKKKWRRINDDDGDDDEVINDERDGAISSRMKVDGYAKIEDGNVDNNVSVTNKSNVDWRMERDEFVRRQSFIDARKRIRLVSACERKKEKMNEGRMEEMRDGVGDEGREGGMEKKSEVGDERTERRMEEMRNEGSERMEEGSERRIEGLGDEKTERMGDERSDGRMEEESDGRMEEERDGRMEEGSDGRMEEGRERSTDEKSEEMEDEWSERRLIEKWGLKPLSVRLQRLQLPWTEVDGGVSAKEDAGEDKEQRGDGEDGGCCRRCDKCHRVLVISDSDEMLS